MSKQRYLLILIAVTLTGMLSAGTDISLKADFGSQWDRNREAYLVSHKLLVEHEFGPGWELSIDSEMHGADRLPQDMWHKRWHSGFSALEFSRGGLSIQGGYRNTAYGGTGLYLLYPAWAPSEFQKPRMQHQGYLKAEFELEPVKVNLGGSAKHLRYSPYLLDPQSFELVEQDAEGVSDFYLDSKLRLRLTDLLSATVAADYKDGAFAKAGEYELSSLTLGLNAEQSLGAGRFVGSSLTLKNRDGASIPGQRRNQLQAQLRVQYQLLPSLSGYLGYIHTSFLDAEAKAIYFNSNYLRGQVMWNYSSDLSNLGYLTLGAAANHLLGEDYYAAGSYRIIPRLYVKARIDVLSKHDPRYRSGLSWYFTPVSEINLEYRHRGKDWLFAGSDYLGLATSLYW